MCKSVRRGCVTSYDDAFTMHACMRVGRAVAGTVHSLGETHAHHVAKRRLSQPRQQLLEEREGKRKNPESARETFLVGQLQGSNGGPVALWQTR